MAAARSPWDCCQRCSGESANSKQAHLEASSAEITSIPEFSFKEASKVQTQYIGAADPLGRQLKVRGDDGADGMEVTRSLGPTDFGCLKLANTGAGFVFIGIITASEEDHFGKEGRREKND